MSMTLLTTARRKPAEESSADSAGIAVGARRVDSRRACLIRDGAMIPDGIRHHRRKSEKIRLKTMLMMMQVTIGK